MAQPQAPFPLKTSPQQITNHLWRWVDTIPARHVDRFLVILRWIVLLLIGIPSLFGNLHTSSIPIPLPMMLGLLTLYNIPISIYLWRKKPLQSNRVGWLLLGDTIIALLTVLLTGGFGSFFFVLFMQVIAETALTLRWQPAFGANRQQLFAGENPCHLPAFPGLPGTASPNLR